ncbi:PCC domain-containing protein [Rhodococcus jostii]|uniref:PCC domain-containing protein n=1 Tax=Rhodococcus jostii TaxID=132919 RepID=UPI00365D7E92
MTTSTPTRILRHPGPAHPNRRQSVATQSAAVHTTLRPGARLIDALTEAVDRYGSDCVQIELMGGTFDRISYCVPACGTGSMPVSYSETHEAPVPAQLLTASVTFGYRDGERFMHCHALWIDAHGNTRAGHLWPATVLGSVPVYAVLHTLPGVTLVSEDDRETLMPAFTPKIAHFGPPMTAVTGHRRANICRILPGEDIVEAAEEVCRTAGISHALIRASVGSLVGGCLHRGDDEIHVDGPATEIISITGTVAPDREGILTGTLSGILVDRHGEVHAGPLVRGHNPVAVTFELLIIEERKNQ